MPNLEVFGPIMKEE
jgi:hypothetical protein